MSFLSKIGAMKASFNTSILQPKTRTGKWLASTILDQRGVAAVEFAFIAPLMLIFYFGMVEITLAVNADRATSHATSLAGDLAAQNDVVTIGLVEDYVYAALAVLDVDATEALDVGLELYSYEVIVPDDPATAVDERVIQRIGLATFGPAFPGAAHDPYSIEKRILSGASGVVVARMNYEYNPKVSQKFVGQKTFDETFMLKPRRSQVVRFDNENGNPLEAMRYEMSCTLETIAGQPTAQCVPQAPTAQPVKP